MIGVVKVFESKKLCVDALCALVERQQHITETVKESSGRTVEYINKGSEQEKRFVD